MKYNELTQQIDRDINTNGNRGITGAKLNSVLNEMVSVLGDGFRIAGEIVHDSPAPTNPENGLCYIAKESGFYENFGNIQVNDYELAIIYYDSDNESWVKTGWERKDFGFVHVGRTTYVAFGEEEMEELFKDVAFIVRNDADNVEDRLFVKDKGDITGLWFYAAPMLGSDLAGDLVLSQGYINVQGTPSQDGKYHYSVGKTSRVLPIKENVEYALSLKQDALTFDTIPTTGSTNPITSGGVKNAISGFIDNTVSNLVNYYTKSETYTKTEVTDLIAAIHAARFEVVQSLPVRGETNVIYLLPASSPTTGDVYNEYVYANDDWELIGTTSIDLSNYYTKGQVDTLLSRKLDKPASFTNGNFTKFDTSGNLVDSGEKASDFASSAQGAKADNAIRYNEAQTLTDSQRVTALANVSNQAANAITGKMGYKVLKNTESFASQVTDANTIYEIRDVFDFGNETIEMPANCTLKFNGGLLHNGCLVGNNTSIEAGSVKVFGDNLVMYKPCFVKKNGNYDETITELQWDSVSSRTVVLPQGLSNSWKVTTSGYRRCSFKHFVTDETKNNPNAIKQDNPITFASIDGDGNDIISFDNDLILDKNPGSFIEVKLSDFGTDNKLKSVIVINDTLNGLKVLYLNKTDDGLFIVPNYSNYAFFSSNNSSDDLNETYLTPYSVIDLNETNVYVTYLNRCAINSKNSLFNSKGKLSWWIGDNYSKSYADLNIADQSRNIQSAFDCSMDIESDIKGIIKCDSTLYLEIGKSINLGSKYQIVGNHELVSNGKDYTPFKFPSTVFITTSDKDMIVQRNTVMFTGGLLTTMFCNLHKRNIWVIDGAYRSSDSVLKTSMKGKLHNTENYKGLSTYAGIFIDGGDCGGYSSCIEFDCAIGYCQYGLYSIKDTQPGDTYLNTSFVKLFIDRYYEGVHVVSQFGSSQFNIILQSSTTLTADLIDKYRNAYINTARATVSVITWDFGTTRPTITPGTTFYVPYRKVLVTGLGTTLTGNSTYPESRIELSKNYGYPGFDANMVYLQQANLFNPALNDVLSGLDNNIIDSTKSYYRIFKVKDNAAQDFDLSLLDEQSKDNENIDAVEGTNKSASIYYINYLFGNGSAYYFNLEQYEYIELHVEAKDGYYLTKGESINAIGYGSYPTFDNESTHTSPFERVKLIIHRDSSSQVLNFDYTRNSINMLNNIPRIKALTARFYFSDKSNRWGYSELNTGSRNLTPPMYRLYMFISGIRNNTNWMSIEFRSLATTNISKINNRIGEPIFNSTLKKEIWYKGNGVWVDGNNQKAVILVNDTWVDVKDRGNSTTDRPDVYLDSTDIGFVYYDTELKKEIMWFYNTASDKGWCNVDGTPLNGGGGETTTYSVIKSQTIVLSNDAPDSVNENSPFIATIENCNNFEFIQILMGEIDITSFVYNKETHVIYIGGVNGIINIFEPNYLKFTNSNDDENNPTSTIQLNANGTPPAVNLEIYESSDSTSGWKTYTIGDVISLSSVDDYVLFRGTNDRLSSSSSNYYQFAMSGKIDSSGDITSILNGIGGDYSLVQYCFHKLFIGCSSLISMPNMPSTTVDSAGYQSMYHSCTGLLEGKYIATINITGSHTPFNQMFYGCSAIKSHHFANICYGTSVFGSNSSCEEFIIDAVTPPTIGSTTITGLKSDCIIYVPDDSVNAYKAAEYWSARAEYIKGISERQNI